MIKNVYMAMVALLLSAGAATAQNCTTPLTQLTNGTTADATQVMANFNTVVNCINNLSPQSATLQGYLGGLTMSNDIVSPTTVIDVTAGVAASDDVSVMMKLSAFSKNANAAWVAGTGAGCLDNGSSLTASTWYHLFVIERTDTGATDLLCSTSVANPTLPQNFTKKRRIGSFRADASAHILAFSQNGDEFLWVSTISDANNVTLTTTPTLFVLTVPTGMKITALFRGTSGGGGGAGSDILLQSPDETPQAVNVPIGNLSMDLSTAFGSAHFNLRTNTNAQIRAVSGQASGTILNIGTYGWIDTRGRFN